MKQIKICGMKYLQNIKEIECLKPDFMGFIFYKNSTRYVGNDFNTKMLELLSSSVKKVAVFVNESIDKIEKIYQSYQFDYVQLHGTETPEFCEKLQEKNIKIIKAFAIDEYFDFSKLEKYEPICDYFLFDTKGKYFGGNGQTFNWNLLDQYSLNTPFFLSGGIDLENLPSVLQLKYSKMFGIDFNSKLEIETAVKSTEITEQIIKKIRAND